MYWMRIMTTNFFNTETDMRAAMISTDSIIAFS